VADSRGFSSGSTGCAFIKAPSPAPQSCSSTASPGWAAAPAMTSSSGAPYSSLNVPGPKGWVGYYLAAAVSTMEECEAKCAANAACKGYNWLTTAPHSEQFPCQLGTVVDPRGFLSPSSGCAFVKVPIDGGV
jgi:hypothetical protein